MAKFKLGMKAYDLRYGVVETESIDPKTGEVVVDLIKNGKGYIGTTGTHYLRYFSDGRIHRSHDNPMLLTLEEAEAKGYEIPKEPMRFECDVLWVALGGKVYPTADGPSEYPVGLSGKRGKLTFVESD